MLVVFNFMYASFSKHSLTAEGNEPAPAWATVPLPGATPERRCNVARNRAVSFN